MTKKLALVFSIVFQPLVIPTLVFLFFMFITPEVIRVSENNKGVILLLVFLTTFIIPLISILILWLTKSIKSLYMMNMEDRVFPFSIVSLFYVMATYFFHLNLSMDFMLVYTLSVITICIILLTCISFFWRISAHMTGISGFLAIITVTGIRYPMLEMLYPQLFAIMVCGGIATSRLYLNAHTPSEVLGGFMLGFSVCAFSFYYVMF